MNINEVELSCVLSHNATVETMVFDGSIIDSDGVWEDDIDNECSKYSDKAQKIFDKYYDYFYDMIVKCKID